MKRARLMAMVRRRWWRAQVPVRRRESICAVSAMKRLSRLTSL